MVFMETNTATKPDTRSIKTYLLPLLNEEVAKINKRADKLGLDGKIVVTEHGRWIAKGDKDWGQSDIPMVDVTVTGTVGLPGGFKLLGTVDITGEENLINFPFLDEDENADIRYRTLGDICEHCNRKNLGRNKLIVVVDTDGNEVAVGTKCAKDYFGVTGDSILSIVTWEPDVFGDEDDDEFMGGGFVRQYSTNEFINAAAQVIENFGYQKEGGTREMTLTLLTGSPTKMYQEMVQDMTKTVTKDEVAAAIEWAAALPGDSDFEHNMGAIARQDYVGAKRFGIAAYIFEGYRRSVAKAAEKAIRDADKPEPMPVPEGKKIAIEGTVISTKMVESMYGTTEKMLVMVVEDGKAYKVWGSVPKAIADSGNWNDDGEYVEVKGVRTGDTVSFIADKVERSDRDIDFGFFKVPRKATFTPKEQA